MLSSKTRLLLFLIIHQQKLETVRLLSMTEIQTVPRTVLAHLMTEYDRYIYSSSDCIGSFDKKPKS
jgi:hypothetical protein